MYFCKLGIPHRDGTAWLGWEDSNSEMSSQNIPLKGRTDFRGSYIRCSNLVRIAAISSLNFKRHFLSRARTSSVVDSSRNDAIDISVDFVVALPGRLNS